MNIRNCPICNVEIQYTNKRSWYNAKKRNSKCKTCQSSENSKNVKEKIENGWKPYIRDKKIEINKNFFRLCPQCNYKIYHTSEKSMKCGIREKRLCNSCSSYKYNKTFKNIINQEHIKQMRATKAGFSNWDEYVQNYPKKQFYKREVWRLTYKQPLNRLKNWNKRGRCGINGAYQLDHIKSIDWGWNNNISAEDIAKWENLRMIPWEVNRKKGKVV